MYLFSEIKKLVWSRVIWLVRGTHSVNCYRKEVLNWNIKRYDCFNRIQNIYFSKVLRTVVVYIPMKRIAIIFALWYNVNSYVDLIFEFLEGNFDGYSLISYFRNSVCKWTRTICVTFMLIFTPCENFLDGSST